METIAGMLYSIVLLAFQSNLRGMETDIRAAKLTGENLFQSNLRGMETRRCVLPLRDELEFQSNLRGMETQASRPSRGNQS